MPAAETEPPVESVQNLPLSASSEPPNNELKRKKSLEPFDLKSPIHHFDSNEFVERVNAFIYQHDKKMQGVY
jgi:hypothetical protein